MSVVGFRPAAAVAAAAAFAALFTARQAVADRIELRGGAAAVEGTITGSGPGGVEIRSGDSGAPRRIPWSVVRSIEAPGGGAALAPSLEAGENLWRGRLRAERGDWMLALEPLGLAARHWDGAIPSVDGLVAAGGHAEALVRAGRHAEAVRPAFEAIRLLRSDPTLAGSVGGTLGDALARVADPAFPIPVSLSPTAFPPDAASKLRGSMRGFAASGDPELASIVESFLEAVAQAAAQDSARPTARPPTAGLSAADRGALDALRAIRDAASKDPRTRARAVAALLAPASAVPDWFSPSVLLAAGRALAADQDRSLADAGRVLLAAVASCTSSPDSSLLGRAAAEFKACTLPPPEGGTMSAVDGALPAAEALAVPREFADAAASWLEDRGEADLLQVLLEGQVAAATDPVVRAAIVARIAGNLAARLEIESDATRRGELMERALALVRRHAEGSEELRFVVLRSQHRAAQRVAEDRRAGRGSDEDCVTAMMQLRGLARDLGDLSRAAQRRGSDSERGATFQVGIRVDDFLARAARSEEISRSAQYFRAWASYYAAWLGRELDRAGWRGDANAALAGFAGLIETGKTTIDPKDVSEDLRGNESFASTILGTGLAYAILDSPGAVSEWLSLLDAPKANPAVRARLGAWRLAAAIDLGDFGEALRLLRIEADGPQGATASLVAAARASRDPARAGAAELLTEAVGNLAAAGRLRDLAAVAMPEDSAAAGPGARLAAAVRAITEATRLRDAGDRAAADSELAKAADDLAAASGPDAPAAVTTGARSLLGYVLRSAGRLPEAADAFLAAAALMQGERAADARWNAVLCLDERSKQGDAAASGFAGRRDREIDVIRRDHPSTRSGTRAAAWRVMHAELPDDRDIDLLLGDDVAPEIAPAARRAALEGIHRRFRAASGEAKAAEARRALTVGDGLAVGAGDDGVLELRRRLEMAVVAADGTRAADAIAAIEARAPEEGMSEDLRQELGARRVQVAVLAGDVDRARAEFEALPRDGAWTRFAARALADATFADGAAPPELRASVARALVAGSREPQEPDVVRWLDAESAILRSGRPAVDADGARRAVLAAIAANPSSRRLQLVDGSFRAAQGDLAGAMKAVRAVLSQSSAGTPEWFEAKALQVEAIAAEDPRKARAVLEQARRLGNGFGPGPAGDRLRSFDQSLPPIRGGEGE